MKYNPQIRALNYPLWPSVMLVHYSYCVIGTAAVALTIVEVPLKPQKGLQSQVKDKILVQVLASLDINNQPKLLSGPYTFMVESWVLIKEEIYLNIYDYIVTVVQ